MRRRTAWFAIVLSTLLWVHWSGVEASAQSTPPVAKISPTERVDIFRRGAALEANHRWAEALTYYEELLHDHPEDAELRQRVDLTRTHYSLIRRYNDVSFRKSLETMDEQESLDLFNEVLIKVQSHYVHTPDWRQLVLEGNRALQIALTNDSFAGQHLRGVPAERVNAFVLDLDRNLNQRDVRDRFGVIDAVRTACLLGKNHLSLPPSAVTMEFVNRSVVVLDEYSTYLTASQLNELYSQIDGNFVGLGIELQNQQGTLAILKVITGSPAERSGMKAGDRIMSVDSVSTEGMSTDRAASLLQGLEGTLVEVGLQFPGEPLRHVRVRRQQIEVPSIDIAKILDPATGVAYLRLCSFQKTTTRELDDALWKLHREGMKSLIFDVRGNPGGLLTTSVEVADRFIASGRIVSTKGRSPDQNWTYSAHQTGTWRMPLVVLIDRDSASASEIFAGAIRDHRRGTLVGQKSYGKGSVQSIFSLNHVNSGLRLTTAKFYSPLGQPFSQIGVSPDITVHLTAKPTRDPAQLSTLEDSTLSEALRVARTQASQN